MTETKSASQLVREGVFANATERLECKMCPAEIARGERYFSTDGGDFCDKACADTWAEQTDQMKELLDSEQSLTVGPTALVQEPELSEAEKAAEVLRLNEMNSEPSGGSPGTRELSRRLRAIKDQAATASDDKVARLVAAVETGLAELVARVSAEVGLDAGWVEAEISFQSNSLHRLRRGPRATV